MYFLYTYLQGQRLRIFISPACPIYQQNPHSLLKIMQEHISFYRTKCSSMHYVYNTEYVYTRIQEFWRKYTCITSNKLTFNANNWFVYLHI